MEESGIDKEGSGTMEGESRIDINDPLALIERMNKRVWKVGACSKSLFHKGDWKVNDSGMVNHLLRLKEVELEMVRERKMKETSELEEEIKSQKWKYNEIKLRMFNHLVNSATGNKPHFS